MQGELRSDFETRWVFYFSLLRLFVAFAIGTRSCDLRLGNGEIAGIASQVVGHFGVSRQAVRPVVDGLPHQEMLCHLRGRAQRLGAKGRRQGAARLHGANPTTSNSKPRRLRFLAVSRSLAECVPKVSRAP